MRDGCDILIILAAMHCRIRRKLSGRSAAWLARLVRDQEVEGSNPFAPTISFRTNSLQTQIYSLTAWSRTRRSKVKSLCPDHFISRSLMDLECNCLVLCNT